MRQVVMELHELKIRSITPAIRIIIENLCNLKVDRLPLYGTVNKMMYEAKFIALLDAGKACLRDNHNKGSANILMNDRTTK